MILIIKNNSPALQSVNSSKVQLVLKVAKSGKTEILTPKVTPNKVQLYLKVARDGEQGPVGPQGPAGPAGADGSISGMSIDGGDVLSVYLLTQKLDGGGANG